MLRKRNFITSVTAAKLNSVALNFDSCYMKLSLYWDIIIPYCPFFSIV